MTRNKDRSTDKAAFYRDARSDLTGPLAGLRVVEVTTTWAGPMCGCMLADFGADVTKVESPLGEIARRSPPVLPGTDPPVGFMHATVNRNKRSLALDLHDEESREVVRALADTCDVFIENFRPGTLDAWGLGQTDLRARNPRLVYVSISGYGQFGPDSDKVGYDPLAQAAGGFLSLNGSPNGEPVKAPTFLADDLAGLHAAFATLAALRHRDATGEGQYIDVSLLDAMLFQSTGYLTLGALGVELPRLGNEYRIAAPAKTYRCQDGYVMAGILLDSHWKRLACQIGRPELADDPRFSTAAARIARRAEVNQLLADWAAEHTVDEFVAEFDAGSIPAAPVRSYAQAAADPHVRERDMLQPIVGAEGEVPLVGPAAKLSRTPIRVRTAAPTLGQHNREILTELGYDPDAFESDD